MNYKNIPQTHGMGVMQALIRVAASIQAANFPKAASDRTINRKLFSNLVVGLIYSTASDVAQALSLNQPPLKHPAIPKI